MFLVTSISFKAIAFFPNSGVDLSIKGSYSQMTPIDQGEIGTCYGHSFINLVKANMQLRRGVSLVDVSMTPDRIGDINGGQLNQVYQNLKARTGECLEYINGQKTGRT
jgi:hypothetical protein